ncbi:Membrane-bound lytic murein transglycosylase D precursor [Serratia sp. 2880STDY5682894]|uniref:transglycosylase SLT domain-containing protein n=2 Tax=Serratia TaxID=613 RepID=UPI00074551AD|nr:MULTISPECIES: transglycosylase SLT domain-containing protein [Serratia]CUZ90298.1 Membrane-bound lytic murein transglycosylase D precursor [Serratia marcescens]CVC25236.1 Membrane-bound lytic murein transglycosylase D precursor [Serratia sp. 2880STDY5682894]CVF39025.1 Membrane-bound lytic murein transglycosylase D precursor [Serratia marcescens]CVH67568.1 Membrane-bound lytic murein transglycosylase D precursor [Serratia marcescens]
MVLDELVLALGIDDKNFSAGEQAVVAGLDRLTAVMENVAQAFDTGEKKSSEALDKTGKKADKTAKDMEASGKKAASFFSSIRAQVLALAGVTLSLGGLKSFVTGFTSNLNQLATAADAFGMSAKSLDGWTKAGEAFGVSANEIVGAFSRINDAKARLKSGLGLDPQLQSLLLAANQAGANIDLGRDGTEDIVRKLAAAFPNLNKDQQQAYGSELGYGYAAQQWFGSGHALRDVDRFTARSGVDDQSIAAARKFRQQWAEISQAFEKTGYILFNALLPYIKQFNAWLNDLANWMAQHPDEIKAAVQGVFDVLSNIVGVAGEAAKAVGGWQNAILLLVSASVGGKLLSLFKGLSGALMGPAGLIAALVALEEFVVKPLEEKYPALKDNPVADFLNNLPGSDWVNELGKKLLPWRRDEADPAQFAQSVRRPQPTKAGEEMLAWLQPKLSKLEETFGLPAGLLRSMVITESGGDTQAVSKAGAKGPFQFMPGTAKDFGLVGDDVFDPEKSAHAAARYMSQLLKMFDGDLGKALAAYNWGQGNVERKGLGAAPQETREYVPKVLSNLPQPGAGMAAQARQPVGGSQSTITETTHIGTLQVNSPADSTKGIIDDARQKINRSSLVGAYASGVST